MAELRPQEFKSKSGAKVIVRSATKKDASAMLDLARSVLEEEVYQLTSGAEFAMTIESEENWIESFRANPNHIILVAEIDLTIVGLLDFSNGRRQRNAHTGEFGMSVEKFNRDQGVGSLLLKVLIEWASQNRIIERIGLEVHSNNERAIALYKKMGFEIEGVKRRALKYGENQYLDIVLMGRFV